MKFETIRQFASRGILTEYTIRNMVRAGDVPGVQCGNRFLINTREFLLKLGQEVAQ